MKRLQNLLGKDILLVGMFPCFSGKNVKWKIKALFRILWKKLKHGKSPLCPFHSGTGLKSWQFQVLFYNFFSYHFKLKILCLLIFRYNTPKYLTDQVQGLRYLTKQIKCNLLGRQLKSKYFDFLCLHILLSLQSSSTGPWYKLISIKVRLNNFSLICPKVTMFYMLWYISQWWGDMNLICR